MDVSLDQSVMTYNLTSGELQPGVVVAIYITSHTRMYVINGYLKVAYDQDLWTNHGWVQAQNLTYSDSLFNALNGHSTKVNSIRVVDGNFTMYDFYVETNSDYVAWMNVMQDRLP